MEGAKIGDGKTSPFGNGKGATMAGPSSGGHDFVKQPSSNAGGGGGHDFVKSPGPNPALNTGGKDFTKGDVPEQKEGAAPDLCPESVADGGRFIHKDAPEGYGDVGVGSIGHGKKPFKIKGA